MNTIKKLAEQIARSIPVQNAFYRHNLYTSVPLPPEREAAEVEQVVAALEPILTAALSPLVEAAQNLDRWMGEAPVCHFTYQTIADRDEGFRLWHDLHTALAAFKGVR